MTDHEAATFLDTLHSLTNPASAQSGQQHALLIVRLAGFQRLRGVYSYRWCDRFSEEADAELKNLIPRKDYLCRMQQGEYGLIVTHLADRAILGLAATKISRCLKTILDRHKTRVAVPVVIGAAVFSGGDVSAEDILTTAHAAAIEAESTKSGFTVCEIRHREDLLANAHIESALLHAVTRNQFELWFQPQLDLHSQAIVSAEALIRWNPPDVGMVPPDVFIPVAEKCGLICQVTEWVIHNAARITKRVRGGGLDYRTSVNISVADLMRPGLLDMLSEIVSLWELSPENFTLELTEGEMLKNPDHAKNVLHQCREHGFRIAIDDFGTGYSSLSYLRQLPLNELKIDKSFVVGLLKHEQDKQIVRTILALAENFHVEVVAEGVEDEATVDFLRELGCAKIQGYWLSRPLPEGEFTEFMVGAVRPARDQ